VHFSSFSAEFSTSFAHIFGSLPRVSHLFLHETVWDVELCLPETLLIFSAKNAIKTIVVKLALFLIYLSMASERRSL
jgi:hypothetical protein